MKISRREALTYGAAALGTGMVAGSAGYFLTRKSPPPGKCNLILFDGIGPHNVVRRSGWMEERWPDTSINYLDNILTGAEAIPAMAPGAKQQVDIAMIGSVPAAIPIVQRYDYPCFYSLMIHGNSEGLVLRKGAITDAENIGDQLNKLRLWSPKASTAEFMLAKYLEIQGADININNDGPDVILELWKKNVVDGAYTWGAALIEMLKDGEAVIYSGSDEFTNKGYLTADICLVRRGFYLEHPDFVKDYASQLDRAVGMIRSNLDKAVRVIAGDGASSEDIKLLKQNSSGVKYQKLAEQQRPDGILGEKGLLGRLFEDAAAFLESRGHLDVYLLNKSMPDRKAYYDAVLRV